MRSTPQLYTNGSSLCVGRAHDPRPLRSSEAWFGRAPARLSAPERLARRLRFDSKTSLTGSAPQLQPPASQLPRGLLSEQGKELGLHVILGISAYTSTYAGEVGESGIVLVWRRNADSIPGSFTTSDQRDVSRSLQASNGSPWFLVIYPWAPGRRLWFPP